MSETLLDLSLDKQINLAPMECFTSCMLTYLNMAGKDYSRLLLDYWNLDYKFKTILSSKDAARMSVDYYYGIHLALNTGDIHKLTHAIHEEKKTIILLCTASKLDYFPRNMLNFESSGFQHCILVNGWNRQTERYIVADPTIGFVGEVDPLVLIQASSSKLKQNEIIFYTITDDSTTIHNRSAKELLAYATERNYNYYMNVRDQVVAHHNSENSERTKHSVWLDYFSNRYCGGKALERFLADLKLSFEWKPTVRIQWYERNRLMITSLITTRSKIWESYLQLGVMTAQQEKQGNEEIAAIIKKWKKLYYLLMKYTNNNDFGSAIKSIEQTLNELREKEEGFLKWMYHLGQYIREEVDHGEY